MSSDHDRRGQGYQVRPVQSRRFEIACPKVLLSAVLRLPTCSEVSRIKGHLEGPYRKGESLPEISNAGTPWGLRKVRLCTYLSLLLLAFFSLVFTAHASAFRPSVVVLTVKGAVSPVMARYLDRGISKAESTKAAAVIIQLDTPGGLDSSMREIVQRINRSTVPVVVYVSPSGARAASAGAFITMAAHVAAMAPNTAIGAAHPVAGGSEDMTSVQSEKATNDAVAYIRSIAELRGRNAEWAERAVRESISASVNEAVNQRVVDYQADNLDSLLRYLDERSVDLAAGRISINVAGASSVFEEMTFIERLLFAISDPNIAFILMSLAMLGIFFELSNPGVILPGIVGGISLLLALFSLGMLPVNLAGVLLMLLAFLLFWAEIWVTSHGVLTIGGVTALGLGGMILISSNDPELMVDRWLIFSVAAAISAFFIFVVSAIVRTQRVPSVTGLAGMTGMKGIARTDIDPTGIVFVHGERWNARSENGRIEAGEEVVVDEASGLQLSVKRMNPKANDPSMLPKTDKEELDTGTA